MEEAHYWAHDSNCAWKWYFEYQMNVNAMCEVPWEKERKTATWEEGVECVQKEDRVCM